MSGTYGGAEGFLCGGTGVVLAAIGCAVRRGNGCISGCTGFAGVFKAGVVEVGVLLSSYGAFPFCSGIFVRSLSGIILKFPYAMPYSLADIVIFPSNVRAIPLLSSTLISSR